MVQLYHPYSVISKKRDGKLLTSSEIEWFVNGVTNGLLPDYQISSLLMAIAIRGLDMRETTDLTRCMLHSGQVLTFNDPTVIDKHSTGGVGDKASFILAPIAASCGVKVPMIAGRGLGHTGGTIDKMEAIQGLRTQLSTKEFKEHIEKYSFALIGQTQEIAPADKKLYALRDVTGTVESIPLITASIMSKKLAIDPAGIVMDIKFGNGAFMQTKKDARALAKSLREVAKSFDKGMITILSDMSSPLGHAVGNSLEMIESIDTLKNKGPKDLGDLSVTLAGAMIHLGQKANTLEEGIRKAKKALKTGKALEKFREFIKAQSGDVSFIDDYSKFPLAKNIHVIKSPCSGLIQKMDCKKFGLHSLSLGGGRSKQSDQIDFGVGLIVHKKTYDRVKKGEALVSIYFNEGQEKIVKDIEHSLINHDYSFTNKKLERSDLISEIKITYPKN